MLLLIVKSSLQCVTEIINLIDCLLLIIILAPFLKRHYTHYFRGAGGRSQSNVWQKRDVFSVDLKDCTVHLCVGLMLRSVVTTATDSGSSGSAHPAAPVFVVQPDPTYYVVKSRAVTLRCGARPAVQISVQCAGQWISPARQVNREVVDPATGARYLETRVDVGKEQVEAAARGQDFRCECHAWNNVPNVEPLLTRSRQTTVHVACERCR